MLDIEILEEIKKGNNKVISDLYKILDKSVNYMVKRGGGDIHISKDIIQLTIFIFWDKLQQNKEFKLTCKLHTYLYSIANKQWLKFLEKNRKNDYVDILPEYGVYDNHFNDENNKILYGALSKLRVEQSNIIKDYYFENLTMNEIAKKHKYNGGKSAKSQKWKAFNKLEKIIKEEYSFDDIYYK